MNNGRRSKHGLNRRMRRKQAKLEANRRFAVYHIREDDEDFLFTNDYYQTPMQAAHRYRLYDRGELSSRPESFAGAFPESRTMRLEEFQAAAADIRSDPRITALLEFNLDEDGSAYAAGIMPGRPMGCRTSRSPPTRRTVRLTAAKTAAGKSSMPTSAVGSWTEKGSGRTAVQ